MAQRKSNKSSLDQMLRVLINEAVEAKLERALGGRDVLGEIRELRATLQRLERKLERSGGVAGGARKKGPGKQGRPGRPPIYTHCTVSGCNAAHYAKGLCSKHYQQLRRAESAGKAVHFKYKKR